MSSVAAAKYRASSFADITRSLCRSPGKSLIFGADGTVPHSNANFNIRRRTRRELLTELTCSFCDSRFAENAAIFSVVISSSLQSASGLKPLMARRLGRYQSRPCLRRGFLKRGLDPRFKPFVDELSESWGRLLFADAYLTLCERGAVRGFHLPCNLVVALVCGLAHEPALPHKLVPVDAAGTPPAALGARAVRSFLIAATFE